MSTQQSQMRGRAILIVFPKNGDAPPHEELIVQIMIDCPDCGEVQISLPGHHLRALHQLLGSFLTEFPSTHLSGDLGELQDQIRFATSGPQNPRTN